MTLICTDVNKVGKLHQTEKKQSSLFICFPSDASTGSQPASDNPADEGKTMTFDFIVSVTLKGHCVVLGILIFTK